MPQLFGTQLASAILEGTEGGRETQLTKQSWFVKDMPAHRTAGKRSVAQEGPGEDSGCGGSALKPRARSRPGPAPPSLGPPLSVVSLHCLPSVARAPKPGCSAGQSATLAVFKESLTQILSCSLCFHISRMKIIIVSTLERCCEQYMS